MKITSLALTLAATCAFASCRSSGDALAADAIPTAMMKPAPNLDLGSFSVSLSVKDIEASRAFYGALGFEPAGGNPAQNWQILRNGDHVIGLFQGLFPKNMMTFNPGWSQQAEGVDAFTDIRALQRHLEERGIKLDSRADENSTGPASIVLTDPDGNPILIDQHVPAPSSGN